ncbi:MAG TPA: site-2 protease family protein [Streptosporangiaceae bacterium]|nr:site-2 protease family protein [Streptosporangiaceae bacterium]
MSITRSPDSTRSGPGAAPGPGRPRGGLRLAGFQVRLTLGAQLLAMLTVLAGAFILPDLAPGRPAVAYLAATAVLVIGFLASLIAHELAHAVVARRYGATAEEIRIGFFGGTVHGRHEYATPRGLWRAAAAGPAASLILAAASVGIALGLIGLGAGRLPVAVFAAFAWLNIVLAVLHLLPGAGLDGGRLVQALAWARSGNRARATMTGARVAQIAGALLIAGGVTALAFGYLDGIWPGLIGLVMISTARAQAREVQAITALSGLCVRDVLPRSGPAAEAVPGWHTVQSFLDGSGGNAAGGPGGRLGASGAPAFPLRDFEGHAAGLLTLSQLALVPADRRAQLRLMDVATPPAQVVTTTPDEPLGQLLARVSIRPATPAALHTAGHALVLTEDGAPAGVLTPDDFRRAAQADWLARGGPGP